MNHQGEVLGGLCVSDATVFCKNPGNGKEEGTCRFQISVSGVTFQSDRSFLLNQNNQKTQSMLVHRVCITDASLTTFDLWQRISRSNDHSRAE